MRHEIWVFSGLGSSIFPSLRRGTKAIEKLIDALPYAEADHAIWDEWPVIADGIIERWKRTREPFKTAMIGHSNGVIAATSIAARLKQSGLRVDYIAAIDPTAGAFPDIGWNVSECSEFWASSGWPAFARWFSRGKSGQLHFAEGWPGIHRLYHIPGSHVACASNPRVHEQIINDLKRVLS